MRLAGILFLLFATMGKGLAYTQPLLPVEELLTPHLATTPEQTLSSVRRTVWRDGMIHGVLSNGLNYYLLPTQEGSQNLEIRLVLPVGSYVETVKGVAHFIEHLAFDGTTDFPHKSMIHYWESLGMKYGRDINAFTGHDRTVYTLTQPLGTAEQTDSTLHAVSQWLGSIGFDSEMIEQERSIIQAEQQAYQTEDVFYPLKIGIGTDRGLPIGTPEQVQRIRREDLLQYHRLWYQPQYASLIIAGDCNTQLLEQLISRHFAPLRNTSAYLLPRPTLQYNKGVTLHSVRDAFSQHAVLELIVPHRTKAPRTLKEVAENALKTYLATILRQRVRRHSIEMDVDNAWYLYDTEHLTFTIRTDSLPELLQGTTLAAAELQLLARQGLTDNEWETLRRDLISRATATSNEAAFLADEWTARAVQGDTLRIDTQQEAYKKVVLQLNNTIVQQIARQWLQAARAHLPVALTLPKKTYTEINAKAIKKAWNKGKNIRLTLPLISHYEYKIENITIPEHLLTPLPANNVATQWKHYPELNISETFLPNGIRLLCRPTESDQITVILIGKGGTADLSDENHARYEATAAYMDMGGTQRIRGNQYTELLLQENITINPGIGAYHHQLMGTAPAAKTHLLFGILREKILEPERCYADFEQARAEELQHIGTPGRLERMLKQNTDYLVERYIDRISGISERQYPPKTIADVRAQHLDSMATWYRKLFTQTRGTTLLILGKIPSKDSIVAEVHAAFGDFTGKGKYSSTTNLCDTSETKTKQFVDTERRDMEINRIYTGKYTGTLRTELTLKLVRDLIQRRLIDILREQHRITYSPYVTMQQSGIPQHRYSFRISCATKPEKEQQVLHLLDSIVSLLHSNLVSQHELQTLKTSFITTKTAVLHESATSAWRDLLLRLIEQDIPIAEYEAYDSVLQSITPQDIQHACQNYLHIPHDVIVTPVSSENELKQEKRIADD